tara:strand:+ start:74 stop:268 length:195 start_codon:yes stop_codon:yes gene_type:complete
VVFDFAVNYGTGKTATLLQRGLEAEEDNLIGPMIFMKVKQVPIENIKKQNSSLQRTILLFIEDF